MACHNPIRNNVFHLEDGDPYCETGKKQHNESLRQLCGEEELNKVQKNLESLFPQASLQKKCPSKFFDMSKFKAATNAVDTDVAAGEAGENFFISIGRSRLLVTGFTCCSC